MKEYAVMWESEHELSMIGISRDISRARSLVIDDYVDCWGHGFTIESTLGSSDSNGRGYYAFAVRDNNKPKEVEGHYKIYYIKRDDDVVRYDSIYNRRK